MSRALGGLLVALAAALVVSAGPVASQGSGPARVLVATLDDPVTPVTADYLADAVDRAEAGGYRALVVRIDTPGGLDSSMRDVAQSFLAAEVPVVAFVSPRGARAASAGALIAWSTNVVAMAPGTAIGAATPVDLEGGDVESKIVNDAAAFARSLAEARGHSVDFAVDAVRQGRSASAVEAVDAGAADLMAGSLDELLSALDGTVVTVGAERRQVTLQVAGAEVDRFDLGLLGSIRQLLADPNLAFLLMSLGTLAIVYELASPGIGAGGVVGAISLAVGLYSLAVLPVNVVGLALLAVAGVLFVAELYAPGVGVAAVGGTVALMFSGVFLFDEAPGLGVSLAVVAPTALVVGALVVVAGRLVVRSRGAPSATGAQAFLDRQVTVAHVHDGRAQTLLEGAWWTLRSRGRPLVEGEAARVVGVDGLVLEVEPLQADPAEGREEAES